MRILLVRHGDPDYEHDALTEKGRREAALLAELAPRWNMGDCYQSPLGRAKKTASYCLRKLGKTAETLDWLEEFPARLDLNRAAELRLAYPDTRTEKGRYRERIVWDMVPSYWSEHPEYWDPQDFRSSEVACHSDLLEVYGRVSDGLDRLLASYGYVREGRHYRVKRENTATITCFCHFGVSCVILAHLWNISPFALWHSLAMAPTSVTEIVSEEREQGIACFRASRIGDVTHLMIGQEEPSFSARFCEVFSNREQRH